MAFTLHCLPVMFLCWNRGGVHAQEVIKLQFVQKGRGELSESGLLGVYFLIKWMYASVG